MARVLVAMSGGVDSCVVAVLMKEAGHDVVGVTLQLYDAGRAIGKGRSCCATTDLYDAKMVAFDLGIPHYVLNREDKFKELVVDDFVEKYNLGLTPLPCERCNRYVKIADLVEFAQTIDASFVATGHYARLIRGKDSVELHRAVDLTKDQTHFLSGIRQDEIDRLIFPLGGKTKQEIRKMASDFKLHVRDKIESQDLCFIPDGNHVDFIKKNSAYRDKKGDIIHVKTKQKLGNHKGLLYYTIGQRRGIGIAYHKPLYVVESDREKNILYVGEEDCLYKSCFILDQVNLLIPLSELEEKTLSVCLRALQPRIFAKVKTIVKSKMLQVFLQQRGRAITVGQVCSIYDGERLVGGGVIVVVVE